MRKKIIVGNWKMNMTKVRAKEFFDSIKDKIKVENMDVAICPSFTLIDTLKEVLKDTNIKVGAQNVHFEKAGEYTGEVSLDMLIELAIDYCIIGHSERRKYFNEIDSAVNLKVINILNNSNIVPIICVGESREQRENGTTYSIVEEQIEKALVNIPSEMVNRCILAYEPLWAISINGENRTATAEQAEDVCKYVRQVIEKKYGSKIAETIRVQYGGSANSKNANKLLNMPNIDGLLVGGASLRQEFVDMIN